MANHIFRFKKFSINQDKTAMKVGTDGVLLGAWTRCQEAKTILDIGTGTGLLALMLAQKCNAEIEAIETDEASCEQARKNIAGSVWNNRISVHHCSFQKFVIACQNKFDLIISNPPYFINSLKTPSESRTIARHNDELPLSDLLYGVVRLLAARGRFCLILPTDSAESFSKKAAESQLFCNRRLFVKPRADKGFKRTLTEFSFNKTETEDETLIIENMKRHEYTEEFKALTNDFYLSFRY